MTNTIVCHLGNSRNSKPQTLAEYGKLREHMIQREWVALSELDFVRAVAERGCPFYGALMNGRDLQEIQYEKLCWRHQSLVGLDFDDCEVSGDDMAKHFRYLGLKPWLGYYTFSSGKVPGRQSYRLLWRTETDLNLTYDQCTLALKAMRRMSNNLSDKHACNPTRMWQGTNSGFFHFASDGKRLDLATLADRRAR